MRYPLRSILAATDLGSSSDAIVNAAGMIAEATGAELHLLRSLDYPWHFTDKAERVPAYREQIEEAEAQLQAYAYRILPAGTRPVSATVLGYAAHMAILDRALEVSADLIVIGAHRGGATGAHFLGTTADRVIRTADIPCLVVKDALAMPIQRVGVPLDFSRPSQGALEIAIAWSLQMGAKDGKTPEIRAMHAGWIVEQMDNPDLEERVFIPELKRQVAHARSRVAGAENLDIDVEVLWGNSPSHETMNWVLTDKIDLLVMGTQGITGPKRILLGSVASSVARQNPCPVLLVPPTLWAGSEDAPGLEP